MPDIGSPDLNRRISLPRRRILGALLAGGGLVAGGAFSKAALAATGGAAGGLSASRLKRLTDGMQGYIDRGDVAGVQTLIYRHGVLAHSDLLGWQDQEAKIPLRRDTIYRIASMSKPVTAVAALILLEEDKFRLEDPVDRWLPELADRKVLKNPAGPLDDTYPSPRPIMVGDLVTQRLGLASSLGGAEGPIVAAMATLKEADSVDDWLKRLGRIPLLYPPGERFIYGHGLDILGHLVARASGMSFPDFLQSRLFGPLGMIDSGFWVPLE
jgi:CubicO group peptidase (beta-lactamase class C family)